MEIYSPAYLFNADGSAAQRPSITGVGSTQIDFGGAFQIFTPDAASIASVVLVRPGVPTHAFDMDQRLVKLSFTSAGGILTATAPPNGNIAPPGYYMLFVLNAAGVPSIATFVQLKTPLPNQRPTAIITSPSGNATVQAGQAVEFAGAGTDPDGTISAYSWSFPGGNPSSSTLQNPGAVVYSTPGTYTASLTVTDDRGATSQTPATRTITVPDFSIAATPPSQSIAPGAGTSYTTTITAGAGFSGAVGLAVSGLPGGATGSFNPTTITGSGSSTLTIATSAATPPGTYQLTINGTAGALSHSVKVTLVVSGTFTISATPASRTVSSGGRTTYTVTVAGAGFAGTVALSASGVPSQTTAQFNPSSIVNAGTSVLTVNVKKRATRGTYTLTITGTSGGTSKSTAVTLVVQ